MHRTEPTGPVSASPRTRAEKTAWFCARQHGVIADWQLVRCGLSLRGVRKRVAASTLFEVYRAVYSLSPVWTADGLRMAAILASATKQHVAAAAISFWSAGEVLQVLDGDPARHHTTSLTSGTRGQRGLRVHATRRWMPGDVIVVRGLRVTSAPRMLLDCAADGLVGRPLERAVAEAEFRKLLDVAALERVLAAHPGHRGLAALGAVDLVAARRRRTESPLEEEVRMLLARSGVPEPEGQYRLRGFSGRWYRADFAWLPQRVLLEADGRDVHARALALDDDRARDNDLAAVGWTSLRVTRRQARAAWSTFLGQLTALLTAG